MMKRIALHSVPRSGSSWLGQIFNSSPTVNYSFQPLFSYAFKDQLNDKSNRRDILQFFEEIAESDDNFLNQTDKIASGEYPEFLKNTDYTHIVYKEVRYHHILNQLMEQDRELIVIGLVRNPKAVLNSWYNAPKEFRLDLGWILDEEWLNAPKKNLNRVEEFYGFQGWIDCLEIFMNLENRFSNRFKLVKYDDLLINMNKKVKEIFDFCDLKWNEQTENFILESRQKDNKGTYSVYKDRILDENWKEDLPVSIIEQIDEILTRKELLEYL